MTPQIIFDTGCNLDSLVAWHSLETKYSLAISYGLV